MAPPIFATAFSPPPNHNNFTYASSCAFSEESEWISPPSNTMINTEGVASSPLTPLFFNKTQVPTRQELANKVSLLTSTLTANLSLIRAATSKTWSSHPPLPTTTDEAVSKDKKKMTMTIKKDTPWICDNCGTSNQPFDFLCWFCKTHSRCSNCVVVVVPDEVDDEDLDMPPVDSQFNKLTLLNMPLTDSGDLLKRRWSMTFTSTTGHRGAGGGVLSLLAKKDNKNMPSRKGSATVKVSGVNALSTYY